MSDVFDEVEESLRAERYRSAFSRAWPWLAGLLVLGVLIFAAWWGWREYQARAGFRASAVYQQGVEAAGRNDRTAALRAFTEAGEAGSPGYRALALMQQAALRTAQNDAAGALRLYDEAAEAAGSPLIADVAALQAAFVAMDQGAALPALEERLRPLASEGRPYRVLAREALATAMAANGRTVEARREFVVLSLLEDAPETLRARAQAAIQLIDSNGAAAVGPIAAAARSLPVEAPAAVSPLPPVAAPSQAPAPGPTPGPSQ